MSTLSIKFLSLQVLTPKACNPLIKREETDDSQPVGHNHLMVVSVKLYPCSRKRDINLPKVLP